MSPKTKKPASSSKKDSEKEVASSGKAEKKSAKSAKGAEPEETPVDEAPAVDQDELEEAEDAAAASSGGGGGNAAALAAAGSTEMSASFKNFRHHPDMENFYRFIFENDLRHEALAILDEMMLDKQNKKQTKSARPH